MCCLFPEILAADKQLAEEIKFDLKRVEEEQRRAARAPNTPLPDTPHAQIVSVFMKMYIYQVLGWLYISPRFSMQS